MQSLSRQNSWGSNFRSDCGRHPCVIFRCRSAVPRKIDLFDLSALENVSVALRPKRRRPATLLLSYGPMPEKPCSDFRSGSPFAAMRRARSRGHVTVGKAEPTFRGIIFVFVRRRDGLQRLLIMPSSSARVAGSVFMWPTELRPAAPLTPEKISHQRIATSSLCFLTPLSRLCLPYMVHNA